MMAGGRHSAVTPLRPGTVGDVFLAVLAVLVGATTGWLTGGRMANLAKSRLRLILLLPLGAALEVAGGFWGLGHAGLWVLVGGYAVLVAFALLNWRVLGMILVAAGLAANLAVFALDRGMPVRGQAPNAHLGPRHHGERPSDQLTGLADVIKLGPIGETVSAGDIVLSLGVATVLLALMRGEGSERSPVRRSRTTPRAPQPTG